MGFTSRKNHIFRSQNEENLLKLREVPLNSGLHDSAKIEYSCPQNAENDLTRKYVPLNRLFNESAEIAFSGRQSAENELTRISVSVY